MKNNKLYDNSDTRSNRGKAVKQEPTDPNTFTETSTLIEADEPKQASERTSIKPHSRHPLSLTRRKFMAGGAIGSAGLLAACDCADRCAGVTKLPHQGGTIGINDARAPETQSAPGIGLSPRTLKMVTTWPRDFPGLGDGAENVARLISQISGGAMTVELFAAGELVGALDAFDAVSGGAADLYHGAEYYWTGKSEAYSFFTSVPFGLTALEFMGWIEYGGGQALWDEMAAQFNIKGFQAGNTGHQMGGWFKREINSLEDLRGLKIRMPGMGGEVMRRSGASAIALAGGEIFQALQSGAIDATEWVGPWNDMAFGFHREAKYYYWPGFHEPGAMLSTGINLELWQSLSVQEQLIIEAACKAGNHQMLAQYSYFNALSLETLLREHKVELRRMPEDILDELAKNTHIVMTEIAAQNDLSNRIYNSFRAAMRLGEGWNKIADEAYLQARRRFLEL